MKPDYAFTGFVAEYWDLLRTAESAWDDRAFFHELIERHGEPVLDVGCGTGRLLIEFLQLGWDVDGIDISPEMLDICERKADDLGVMIDVYEQAMEDLDLPREYGTIIVASSAFQLITDVDKAQRAMRRFKDHLRPGGVLAMPFSTLWRGSAPPTTMPDTWTSVTEVTREDGAVIRHSSKARIDTVNQLEHRMDRYEVLVDGEVVSAEDHERSPSARGYSSDDVHALFMQAGFGHVELLDPFTMRRASGREPIYVAVGQNA